MPRAIAMPVSNIRCTNPSSRAPDMAPPSNGGSSAADADAALMGDIMNIHDFAATPT
jgi:hypothetical protein